MKAGGGEISATLAEIAALLREEERLWRPTPFREPRLPWEDDYPAIARGLRELGDHEVEQLEARPAEARRFLARWVPRLADRVARLEIDELPDRGLAIGEGLAEGVPARKWEQIRAFAARVPSVDAPVLEWCSGKGHLGRLLSHLRGQPTRCVERDERLAHTGRLIAEERDLPVDFAVLDALGEAAARMIEAHQLACALHACGELHLALLRAVVAAGTRALALSPCCYHLIPCERYRPVSEGGREHDPGLHRDHLRLAVQETVTAGPAARRRRELLNAWRLGFDLLQREIRGVDAYLPVPSAAPALAREHFPAFVHWAADRKALTLPVAVDYARFERAGRERLGQVRRLSILRHLFRRPIESWLVLDRARLLTEAGYAVEVGVFCARRVTPRNLMIRAWRPT